MRTTNVKEERARTSEIEKVVKEYLDRMINSKSPNLLGYFNQYTPIVESTVVNAEVAYLYYRSSRKIERLSAVLAVLTVVLIAVSSVLVVNAFF